MLKRLFALFTRKPKDLTPKLRTACSSLMLERDEEVLLAPVSGMYGPVHMWGSINPSFEFQAFDPDRKEFMSVRADVSQGKILYSSQTADEGHDAPTHPSHKLIALTLFGHLTRYFPLTPEHKLKRGPHGQYQSSEEGSREAVQDGSGTGRSPESPQ